MNVMLKKVLKVATVVLLVAVVVINTVAMFIYNEIEWMMVLLINIVSIVGIIYSIKNFKKWGDYNE